MGVSLCGKHPFLLYEEGEIVAKRISRNGLLYIFYKDFHNDHRVFGLDAAKKKITSNYINIVMPKTYLAREQAAFNNKATEQEIDSFLFGVGGNNKGYIQKMQDYFTRFYLSSYRNAEKVFASGEINSMITRLIKNGPIEFEQFKKEVQKKGKMDELQRLMKAQKELLDNLSKISSQAKSYALFMANNNRKEGVKRLSKKKIQNGIYNLEDFSYEGQQALKMYQDIKNIHSVLKINAVGSGDVLTQNFSCFRTTAKEFHARYAEYLAVLAGASICSKSGKLFDKLNTAVHSGTQAYHVGQGVSIKAEYIEDPELKRYRQMLSDEQLKDFGTFTVNSDASFKVSSEGLTGTYGGTVKDYSDKSLKNLNDTLSLTSFNNLFTAAALATQYGLPADMASKKYIYSFAGSVTNKDSTAEEDWRTYIELLGTLLSLDALMGRMANNKVFSKANSLIFFDRGQVYAMSDIVQGVIRSIQDTSEEGGSVLKSSFSQHGLWSLAAGIVERKSIEKAHKEVLYRKRVKGKSRSEDAEKAVESAIKTLKFKIGINITSLMKNYMK